MADPQQASRHPAPAALNPRSPPSASKDAARSPTNPPSSATHRRSFSESLRAAPTSPRAVHRQPSLTQSAVLELLQFPPNAKAEDVRFKGRDWREISVGEIIEADDVRFVEVDTSVEDATNLLIESGAPNVVLIRNSSTSRNAVSTFDYSDLLAYLLLVVGLAHPDERQRSSFQDLAAKGREGTPIPLKDVKDLGRKEPLVMLPDTANLTKAVEILGSGVHRIIVVKEGTVDVVGILTQLRLVRFFWENQRCFPAIEQLFPQLLRDLDIGSHSMIAINGDKSLASALELMHSEGITSVPVLDSRHNVIGNISHVDIRLLTKSTSLPLLTSSCIHFVSVILSERGVNDGKDSFPVFHINVMNTLAHTVAKLVATRSHRMWVVDTPSPASSTPPTPLLTGSAIGVMPPTISPLPAGNSAPLSSSGSHMPSRADLQAPPGPPYTTNTQGNSGTTFSAAANPGTNLSGRLSGVVSLTDILNLFARVSGLNPHDPADLRSMRRRSSSVSVGRSLDYSSAGESVGGGFEGGGGGASRR